MNHSINRDFSTERVFNYAVIMIATFAISMVACHGQEVTGREVTGQGITSGDLLHGSPTCGHVISLINRHGVNRTFDQAADRSHLHHSGFGSMIIPATEMGDLQIVSVHQFSHADPTCGPKIAVVVANHSLRCVSNFSVTAVATLGRIRFHSPNATVKVAKIQPGEAFQVELTLPLESLAMGNRNGQVIGFQRLVVAIDCFDELAETDEANNIKAYTAASIPIMEAVVAETVTVSSAATTVETETTVESSQPVSQESVVNETATDPLQSAINQLSSASAATAADGS